MSPEEWPTSRLDDLAAQVRVIASLTTLVATHTTKIDGLDDDVDALRELHREFVRDSKAMLEQINRTCETRVNRVEVKVDELTRAQRWTPAQWSAILGPTLVALIGAVALVVTGGPA